MSLRCRLGFHAGVPYLPVGHVRKVPCARCGTPVHNLPPDQVREFREIRRKRRS